MNATIAKRLMKIDIQPFFFTLHTLPSGKRRTHLGSFYMRKFLLNSLLLFGVLLVGHAKAQVPASSTASGPAASSEPVHLAAAPVARTNWAVTRLGDQVFAFYGLGVGKTSSEIARDVHA